MRRATLSPSLGSFLYLMVTIHVDFGSRIVKSVVLKATSPDLGCQRHEPRRREGEALEDVQIRFGRKLREVRASKNVSQEKLAELAGLHRTYVSSVERGERNISLVNIEHLAKALGVPMADLMP